MVIFDAVMLDALAGAGWIQPVGPQALQDTGAFPLYTQLEALASPGGNHAILTP